MPLLMRLVSMAVAEPLHCSTSRHRIGNVPRKGDAREVTRVK